MTNQPFPVLSAGDFMRKAERVISVIKNIDLSKAISSQLMTAAACIETVEFIACIKETQKSELQIYTGSLLTCTPSLGTYIKHFKEAKNYINNPDYPEAVWIYRKEDNPFECDNSTIAQGYKNYEQALARDLKTLDCTKNHNSVTYLQFMEEQQYDNVVIINDEVIHTIPDKKGRPRNYMELIDSWATGLKTSISDQMYMLIKQCDDAITEISNLNVIENTPRVDALAKGIEYMYMNYLSYYWMEEQAKIEIDRDLFLREYDEEDKEEITNTLISFYEGLREDRKPFPQDYYFIQLWHKHLSKAKTPETYLGFAEEMLSKWDDYKSFFKDGVLGRCFYEIQIDEYVSFELRELRKSGREKHQHQAKESKERLTGILDTEQELINKLVPLFNSEEEAQKFPNRIKGLDDKKIPILVNQLWLKDVIADTTTKQDLWQVLHDAGLYTRGISTWNSQVIKPEK